MNSLLLYSFTVTNFHMLLAKQPSQASKKLSSDGNIVATLVHRLITLFVVSSGFEVLIFRQYRSYNFEINE